MSQKVWKITCAASFLVFFAVGLRFCIRLGSILMYSPNSASVAIIGGADGPTAMYLIKTVLFRDPLFIVALVSFVLFAVSLTVWLVKRSHHS